MNCSIIRSELLRNLLFSKFYSYKCFTGIHKSSYITTNVGNKGRWWRQMCRSIKKSSNWIASYWCGRRCHRGDYKVCFVEYLQHWLQHCQAEELRNFLQTFSRFIKRSFYAAFPRDSRLKLVLIPVKYLTPDVQKH